MKHSVEHDTAKRIFNEVTQLLDKLSKLDAASYAIDFFEQVQADIELEKEVNIQTLVAYYQKLVDELHERKAKCLENLKMDETLGNKLEPINQALKKFDSKVKSDNLDFIIKTVDGDDGKWREIQSECSSMLEKIKALEDELVEIIVGNETIGFRPCMNDDRLVESICGQLELRYLDSFIISSYTMENDLFDLCKLSDIDCELIYRASRDGFEAVAFHAKCDNHPNTLTVIKTTSGYIFGGYTAVGWDSTSGYKADPDAFIFSLRNASADPQLIPIKSDDLKHAIFCDAGFGPTFGGGHDIRIWADSNTLTDSYSELGNSYNFKLFDSETVKAQSFLAGTRNFQTLEIETFSFTKILKIT